MSDLTTLVVSNRRETEQVAPVRDPRQRAKVAEIVSGEDFAFANWNPFTAEVGAYTGPFVFLYTTAEGDLHAARIGKTGRLLQHVVAPSDGSPARHLI